MREPVWDPPPSGVWSFNITVTEADAIISRWAHLEASVIYAEGDLARFVQRRGRVELVRPGFRFTGPGRRPRRCSPRDSAKLFLWKMTPTRC